MTSATWLCRSHSAPLPGRPSPTLHGLSPSQSFSRSQLKCHFFQEASLEPLGGGTSFRAFPQVFPAARAACDPRWLTGGGGRQQAAGGGLHGAEVNPENNSLLLLQGSQTGRAQQGEEGGDWASPCQAPAALLARWVTFSAQLFSRREKFLTLRNRVGTFQMGPRLHWSQGPCSLGF